MKKYKITSIPQSLPKAQLGWFKNRKKRISGTGFQKRNKSSQDAEYEEQDVPVQKIKRNSVAPLWEPQSIPVFPDQGFSIENVMPKRTPEEEANTFAEPFFWSHGETIPTYDETYMVKSDPFKNSLLRMFHNESLAGQMGIPYPGNEKIPRTVQIPERFIPNYFKPVTETGEPLKCTDGKIAYKGQCVTKEALEIILQRELEINKHQWNEEFREKQIKLNQEIEAIRKKNQEILLEQERRINKEKSDEYVEKFKNLKKGEALDPIETFNTNDLNQLVPVLNDKGEPIFDKNGKQKTQTYRDYLKQYYLVIDNKTDTKQGFEGTTSVWPLQMVGERVFDRGFQPLQFQTLWGFNDDQRKQVESQIGKEMKVAKQMYDAEAYKRILNETLDRGITPYEAAKYAAGKNSSFGYADALKKEYSPKVDDAINRTLNETLNELKTKSLENFNSSINSSSGFDFKNKSTVYNYDDDGNKIGVSFDPLKAFSEHWIKQGKTEGDRLYRRNQVNNIKNKNYSDLDKKYEVVSPNMTINPDRGDRMATFYENTTGKNINNYNYENSIKKNKEVEERRQRDLAELIGFNSAFSSYNLKNNKTYVKSLLNDLYDPSKMSYTEKLELVNHIKNNDFSSLNDALLKKSEDAWGRNALQQINSLNDLNNFYINWKHDKEHTISSTPARKPLTTSEKVWDVLSNLDRAAVAAGEAFGSGKDFSDVMWGSGTPTISNNQWREWSRKNPNLKEQLNTRDWLNWNPLSAIGEKVNVFNPANWLDEMYRGYQDAGWSGLRDRTSDLSWDAALEAANFIPAGIAANAAKSFSAAKNAYAAAKGLRKVLPALNVGFTGLNRGLTSLGYPGKWAANYLDKSILPLAFDAITEEIPSALKEIYEGNYGKGIKDLGWGLMGADIGVNRLKNINAKMPRFLEYRTPSGKTFGIGNPNLFNIKTAENPGQWLDLITGSTAPELKNIFSTEADIINAEKALASGEAFPRYTFTHPKKTQLQLEQEFKNLGPKEFMLKNLGFSLKEGQPIQFGTFNQPTKYPTRFGEFTFGPKRFYPAKLEGIEFKSPTVYDEGPINTLGFKKGGIKNKINKAYMQPGGETTHTPIDPRYLEKYPDFQPFIQNEPEVKLQPRHRKTFFEKAEGKINEWLGNPQDEASKFSRDRDNIRHPYASYLTSKKVGPFLGNTLGAAHELRVFANDSRPWSEKVPEMGEDLFNNWVGSKLSILPDSWAKGIIGTMSDNNLLPDGVNRPKGVPNAYVKRNGGYMQPGGQIEEGAKIIEEGIPKLISLTGEGLLPINHNINVTLPDFQTALNENLKQGFGIKKVDVPLRMYLPKNESGQLSGTKFTTFIGKNPIGFIELQQKLGPTNQDAFDFVPGIENLTFFEKANDYPFKYDPRRFYRYQGQGISGEFNKALTQTLQDFNLPPLYSSLLHTPEGLMRWVDLTRKGHASFVHVKPSPVQGINFERFMLHKKGGMVMKLSEKEIDQYIKDGYIIEDE